MEREREVVLVGRSSSHFSRVARIFALELGIPHAFRPVFDLASLDPVVFAHNPALKIPVMLDESGPLFGTENICRALAERARLRERVILRGDVRDRELANVEELTLHVMSTSVTLVMSAATNPGHAPPPKLRASLAGSLAFLNGHVVRVFGRLPANRLLSFAETALHCLVAYLPFRKVEEVSAYPELVRFSQSFGERASARATEYRFDVAPGACDTLTKA